MNLFRSRSEEARLEALEQKVDLLLQQSSVVMEANSALLGAANAQLENNFVHPRAKLLAIGSALLTTFVLVLATYSLAWSHRVEDSANDLTDKTNELVRARDEATVLGVPGLDAINAEVADQSRLSQRAKNSAARSELFANSVVSVASAFLGAQIGWVMTLVFDRTVLRVDAQATRKRRKHNRVAETR